jgi:NAD(P)H dehydrogenase (quinone)
MIAVTGATGQLGRLVIEALLKTRPASSIIAAVRNPEAASDLATQGVIVRYADYDKPESLEAAFAGVENLLLISSSEVGRREPQHKAAIDAAKRAGVKLLAYTSILQADVSPLFLAGEHRNTEAALKASGLDYVILRNGWYCENYAGAVSKALEHGAMIGSAGDGAISAAARRDYAEAAAAVLVDAKRHKGKTYELAGDKAFTMAQLAAQIAERSGKPVTYTNMPQADYVAALKAAGLPEAFAGVLADADAGISKGWLFNDSHTLSQLIGHPTTAMDETISAVLQA